DRVRHTVRGRAAALRHHVVDQLHQLPVRAPIPGGVLMSIATDLNPAARSLQATSKGGERNPQSMVFLIVLWLAMFIAMTVLLVLIVTTLIQGASRLDLRLFTEYPASSPARAGARAAVLRPLWGVFLTPRAH